MSANHAHSNPQYIGPGTWNAIHTLAFNAKNATKQQQCIKNIKMLCKQFPCEKCREHALDYIKTHPMGHSKEKELGLFIWTWKFHNTVNFRIGKPNMSWDMAYHLYDSLKQSDNQECSEECSVSE